MGLDWSREGVDWRDESLDDAMAHDWLRATQHRHNDESYDDEVWERVRELTQSDLDPPRGWRLVRRLVELADSDKELWQIGRDPLGAMVRNHESVIAAELEHLYWTDPKWRQVSKGQHYVPPFSVTEVTEPDD